MLGHQQQAWPPTATSNQKNKIEGTLLSLSIRRMREGTILSIRRTGEGTLLSILQHTTQQSNGTIEFERRVRQ